ncbi:class I SAM-dependent methyltransferase [Lacinutrix jangbogonensis]|uniref:class I SAM-dependent methyltransferase n=1 Tax=Lacinutrix jangbogonensis TaxID=1469557 RepID=UPI00138DE50B|nr:class I SAM-dependent methyltransferase [Lacinutrix jangbogonensis]
MKMIVKSPITSGKTKLLKEIPTSYLNFLYQEGLGLTLEDYFKEIDSICLYQCLDTGYKFFFPFNLSGKELFYKKLELNKWYYQESKWEYDAANLFIKEGDRVLEVGCGRGHFLSQLKKRDLEGIGLELNKEAIGFAVKNDIKVLDKLIEEYAEEKPEKFDVVCAFQLLEHISDIGSFFTQCISLLKPNGRLIFAVPNNEAFFFNQSKILPENNVRYINQLQTLALNLPPHHMGLWDKDVFRKVASNNLNLELVSIKEEPVNSGRKELNTEILKNIGIKNRFLNKLNKFIYRKSLTKGDSLLVVYERK